MATEPKFRNAKFRIPKKNRHNCQGAEVFRWSVRAYAEKEVEIRREYNNIMAVDWELPVVSTADMRHEKNKGRIKVGVHIGERREEWLMHRISGVRGNE